MEKYFYNRKKVKTKKPENKQRPMKYLLSAMKYKNELNQAIVKWRFLSALEIENNNHFAQLFKIISYKHDHFEEVEIDLFNRKNIWPKGNKKRICKNSFLIKSDILFNYFFLCKKTFV